jgi:hypothetical protein
MTKEEIDRDLSTIAGLMRKHEWLRVEQHKDWLTAFPPYLLRTQPSSLLAATPSDIPRGH